MVESSRLRGYATNADVDAAFFDRHGPISSLRDRYRTLDPDLIFNPAVYGVDPDPGFSGSYMKPSSPDSGPRKWGTLESLPNRPTALVQIELTAMDYGAYGEVSAYLWPTCGGGWRPVPAQGGDTVVKIPKDDDGNFIADELEQYRGLAALSDEDDTPNGDGTPGDGFTAFEEYRGFVQSTQESCESPLRVRHERTSPRDKDLFVYAADPLLWMIAYDFYLTSHLEVHNICPAQYFDNQTRVVNFTMHSISGPAALGEGFRGARLTQAQPQHGLYIVNERRDGRVLAESFGFGPPKNVSRISIDVQGIRAAYGAARAEQFLTIITHHELGHAVGIHHHGERNISGPVVLLSTPGCIVGMTEGTVDGQPACKAKGIAVRGQQNSGNALCPMKYLHWDWYEPPGTSLTYSRMVDFRPDTSWGWRGPIERLPGYDGRVNRYRKDLDEPPELSAMRLCPNATGTGINELPMGLNHAGHADRGSCSAQLRVNDVRPGVPSR
jgi:hypothetical protein